MSPRSPIASNTSPQGFQSTAATNQALSSPGSVIARPHALHRVVQVAFEASAGAAVDGLEGTVHRGLSSKVSFEVIEAIRPVGAVGRKPLVDRGERLRPKSIPAPPPLRADLDEPVLAQHLRVL